MTEIFWPLKAAQGAMQKVEARFFNVSHEPTEVLLVVTVRFLIGGVLSSPFRRFPFEGVPLAPQVEHLQRGLASYQGQSHPEESAQLHLGHTEDICLNLPAQLVCRKGPSNKPFHSETFKRKLAPK